MGGVRVGAYSPKADGVKFRKVWIVAIGLDPEARPSDRGPSPGPRKLQASVGSPGLIWSSIARQLGRQPSIFQQYAAVVRVGLKTLVNEPLRPRDEL